jgi:hypothetical protein
LEDVDIHGRMVLNYILKSEEMKLWAGFSWLMKEFYDDGDES